MKTIKVLFFILGMAAIFAAKLMMHFEASDQAVVNVLVQAWEERGPHATVVGALRERLASSPWLGPLRPAPPRDPLAICRQGWLRIPGGKQRLSCLYREMDLALAEHEAFNARFLEVLASICLVVLLALLAPYLAPIVGDGVFPWDTLPRRHTLGAQ